VLVESSLCLEAAERPQWPRLLFFRVQYLWLGWPKSRGRTPSLDGDHAWPGAASPRLVTQFTVGAALLYTRVVVCGTAELVYNIRGRGWASNVCFHS